MYKKLVCLMLCACSFSIVNRSVYSDIIPVEIIDTTGIPQALIIRDGVLSNIGMFYDMESLVITQNTGADGAFHTMDYPYAIALGHIQGHSTFRGYGERSNMTNIAAGNDLWQGTATAVPIPSQSVGERMSLFSTSAQDSAAGTGIQIIDVHYLDATGNTQTEQITLNGTTSVNTVFTNARFIQSIHADQVDGAGVAVGTVSIFKYGDTTTVYNTISPGGNMSLCSARMIPYGKTFYMTNLSISGVDNTSISLRLRSTSTFEDVVTTGYYFLFKDTCVLQNSTREKTFRVPLKFPALCIIKFTAYSTTNGGAASVSYDGWIE